MQRTLQRVANFLAANGISADPQACVYLTEDFDVTHWRLPHHQGETPSMAELLERYPDEMVDRQIASAQLRSHRNAMLRDTDLLTLPDFPLTAEDRAGLAAFRQILRDLPATHKDKHLHLRPDFRLILSEVFHDPRPAILDRPFMRSFVDKFKV